MNGYEAQGRGDLMSVVGISEESGRLLWLLEEVQSCLIIH